MIHPFAHMNSNYAAAKFGLSPFAAASREGFAEAFEQQQQSVAAVAEELEPVVTESAPAPTRGRAGDAGASPAPTETPAETAGTAAAPPTAEDPVTEPTEAPAPSEAAAPTEDESEESPAQVELAPGFPRFDDVPEVAKHPIGPYRQAPEEFGGQWWYVSPFTGEQPWVRASAKVEQPEGVSAEFLSVFGPRPEPKAGATYWENAAARVEWQQNLEYFQGTGIPDGFSQAQVDAASQVFENWGMGKPVFYEGRYGWSARFPDSTIPDFEAAPFTAVEAPHLVVARYQIRMTQAGQEPPTHHPFVPPQVFGREPLGPTVEA